jgi:DNA-binding transcriptional LysR family regulator
MNNLEKQLGCKLFIRSNRGIRLTSDGLKLYRHIAIAHEQIQSAELELENSANLKSGSVTISATETALHGLLLPVIQTYHNTYPGIHIRISNTTTSQAIESVHSGISDLAVVTTPTKIKKPMKQTNLLDFHEVLVCGKRYARLAKEKHHLEEIQQYPMVTLGKDSMTYQFYTDFYYQYGLDYSGDIEAATADQLLPLITHDLGIGFVPESLIAARNLTEEQIYKIPLYEKVPLRSICLIETAGNSLSGSAAELKQMLISSTL